MPTTTLPPQAPLTRAQDRALSVANFAPWLRAFLFFALLAAPAGVVIHLIARYAVDVPFWDQWETARLFGVSRFHHESIMDIARQQNESRLLFPNLIFLALSLPTGTWSVVREMYFSVALVAAVAVIVFQLLRRTGFSLPVQCTLAFLINWLLFSPTQEENWFFGIQICYYLPPTALCFALLANVTERSLAWKTLVALGLSFVAAYSFSGGVLISVLAFPGLLPANWSAAGRWLPSRREWMWHVTYVVVAAIMLTAYFWDYKEPAGAGSLFYMFTHPAESSRYFFAWLGSPLMPRGPLNQSIAAGVFIFLLFVGLLAGCWRALLDRAEQRRLYPWVLLGGYAIATGLVTVIGRSGFGTRQALSSRYITFSSYAYVAILVLATYLWRFRWQGLARSVRTTLLAVGIIVLTLLSVVFANAQRLTMPGIVDGSEYRKFAYEGLVFMPLMPTSPNLDALCGVSEFVRQHALDLLRRHVLNVPLILPGPLRERISRVDERGNQKYGSLDEPSFEPNGEVSIHGWAVDPTNKQPGGPVLITATGVDNVTRPLVVFNTRTYRPPMAPADGIYQAMPCGFLGQARFDRLPPGQYRVAGWRIDTRLSIANQLAETYVIDWGRSGKMNRNVSAITFPALDPTIQNRNGMLDDAVLQPGKHLSASGWAMDFNTASLPKAVLFTATDSANNTKLIGMTVPESPRPDVADALHNARLAYSGYRAVLNIADLPAGDYRIAAWDVDNSEEENVNQMGGIHALHVPPQ